MLLGDRSLVTGYQSRFFELRAQVLEQALGCSFQHVEHAFEGFVSPAVRIGYLELDGIAREFHEELQLARVLAWADGLERLQVLLIHGEHVVELDEVAAYDLTPAQPAQI